MFPEIRHLDDLRRRVERFPEIRFQTNEFGFTVVCYMIATADTFTGPYAPWTRECRGITFYPDGKIASRPLHKFFNVGELPETQESVLPWENLHRVMDKRDGSMLHPILLKNGELILKTKKSFTSDVAIQATRFLHKNPEAYDFCLHCVLNDWTPVFEFTSPKARIVLGYGEDELQLLHVRDNFTGEYFHSGVINAISKPYGIKVVDEYNRFDWNLEAFKQHAEQAQNVEGMVLEFANGYMTKWKTDWYFQMHHAVVFVRERDIAQMVIDETVDDYKSYRNQSGMDIEPVIAIERRVLDELNAIRKNVDDAYAIIKDCEDRKSAAMKLKGHPWFSAGMDIYNGKEFDTKHYFTQKVLKEKFSLEQV